jgi:hypothetical protein
MVPKVAHGTERVNNSDNGNLHSGGKHSNIFTHQSNRNLKRQLIKQSDKHNKITVVYYTV